MRKPHAPKPSQYPPGAPALSDERLLELLLEKAPLTQQQAEAFVGYSVKLAQGLERLPKTVRDHAVAVAKASGILERTAIKKRMGPPMTNPGDCFSSVRMSGTEYAEKLLAKPLPLKPPIRRAS